MKRAWMRQEGDFLRGLTYAPDNVDMNTTLFFKLQGVWVRTPWLDPPNAKNADEEEFLGSVEDSCDLAPY